MALSRLRVALRGWTVVLLAVGGVGWSLDANAQTAPAPVTFSRDIAPLLFDRCARCHHPGGDAPFSLLAYAAVRSRATTIAAVTRRRIMPPWKSTPGYGEFIGHRHLTDEEIDRIQHWVDAGAPEGDPRDLPPVPSWSAGWQNGPPDVVVSLTAPYTVPADGPDFSRTFVISVPVDREQHAIGLEFRPGNAGMVHHANIRIDHASGSRALDDKDPAPGYQGLLLRSAVFPDGHFLGWTPGQDAPLLPTDLAWRVTPGTDLVIETHFVPTGKPEVFSPSAGLYFADAAPTRTPAMLRLGRQDIDIPPGQKEYMTTDSFVLPVDVEVMAVQPHAHRRARQVHGTAMLPDGSMLPLISIEDWDYRWQHVYRYAQPPRLPKGTTVSMRCVFDNSAENPRNPDRPPQPVHWGQRSVDEMGDLWVQMLPQSEADLRVLNHALRVKHATEEVVGYEMMIRSEPDAVSLHNDVALLYAEFGKPEQAAEHFRIVSTLEPESPAAQFNYGTALASLGKPDAAIEYYRRALALRPDYGAAHNNLGQALLTQGKLDDAQREFREAVSLDPDAAGPHYNLGVIARAGDDMRAAIEHFRLAVQLQPDWVEALGSLAWTLATGVSASKEAAEESVRAAERAAALTKRDSAGVLDILAAAQAAAGHFELAAATGEEALRLRPDARLAAGIRQRVALYKQRKPFVTRGRTR